MASADLGYPILVGILVFWALFALSGILSTFLKKENLRDIRDFYHRMIDTSDRHHHSQRG